MKLYAPSYYKSFACIADRCRHSCCIGWEIDVDSAAMEKYAALTDGYEKAIKDSIDVDDTPHFRLSAGDRCPHLDGRGLCRIITELGETYLCHICREHPRFYHDTIHGREVGIGMACEEACRLILTSEDYGAFAKVGEADGDIVPFCGFDGTVHRTTVYKILSDSAVPYPERLRKISSTYGVSPADLSDADWREELSCLEYLDSSHKSLFSVYSSDRHTTRSAETYLERMLAYAVFRHCSHALDEDEFRASLGFCLFVERLLASLIRAGGVSEFAEIAELARILSEELEYSEDNTEAIRSVFFFS